MNCCQGRENSILSPTMRTRTLFYIAIALSGLSLSAIAGCDKDKGSATGGGANVEVRVGYFANVTHAQAVLGVSTGSLEKAITPAKLSTKVFNAGPSLI